MYLPLGQRYTHSRSTAGRPPAHQALQWSKEIRIGKSSGVHGSGFRTELHEHGVADQTDCQTFDFEGLAGLHHNGLIVRVFGM